MWRAEGGQADGPGVILLTRVLQAPPPSCHSNEAGGDKREGGSANHPAAARLAQLAWALLSTHPHIFIPTMKAVVTQLEGACGQDDK